MVGGNTEFIVQRLTTTKNDIGEDVRDWVDVMSGLGWIDMMSGDSSVQYNAKLTTSTHVVLSDWFDFKGLQIKPAGHRIKIDGEFYEITFIDDPMNLHEHLEIFLKQMG